MTRPPNRSVHIPRGSRKRAPVRTGVAVNKPNSVELRPSSARIGIPVTPNIIQTAKQTVNAHVVTSRIETLPPLPSALLLPTALQRTRSASGEPTSHCPGPYAGQNRVDFFARRHTFVRRHAPSPTPMIVAVALTMNVVFELINKEFLFRNYVLE